MRWQLPAAPAKKEELLRFAALRNERARRFPHVTAEEWKTETIEGTAETVCLRAPASTGSHQVH